MSSSSSFVTFTGNAVLENPRSASPRVVVFDMVVYVGSPSLRNITGSVRFFKEEGDETTYPKIGMYNVTTTSLPALSNSYSVLTYVQFYLLEELPENNRWNINPAQLMTVHVCCVVTKDDQKAATFQGEPEQYTIALPMPSAGETPPKSFFPFLAYIPDSPRFNDTKKPTPFTNKFSGFMGYLTGVSGALEGEQMVDRFRIEVETISFMGNYMTKLAKPVVVKKTPAPGQGVSSSSLLFLWYSLLILPLQRVFVVVIQDLGILR
ncbi:hypothetical protein DFH07DRAFT_755148 [Mycena maculata]|uniref:Uncharacterized protein n=1 Tax=Mycena maculata TaxID=230809 RepID=A0AAD7I132_9AGAR|nr:hypothetical protein DFH07DRAFT_755138 [Mycena maculata]KAJ7732795.1 hypothetical protein DFH07DRAFT_755148 [Mycena maculata]